jgi:hypothetical protein
MFCFGGCKKQSQEAVPPANIIKEKTNGDEKIEKSFPLNDRPTGIDIEDHGSFTDGLNDDFMVTVDGTTFSLVKAGYYYRDNSVPQEEDHELTIILSDENYDILKTMNEQEQDDYSVMVCRITGTELNTGEYSGFREGEFIHSGKTGSVFKMIEPVKVVYDKDSKYIDLILPVNIYHGIERSKEAMIVHYSGTISQLPYTNYRGNH